MGQRVFVVVRAWSAWLDRKLAAAAARGKRRKAARVRDTTQTPPRQDDDEFTRRALAPMPSWARLIRRVYEVDPLLCPFCGAEMKILASSSTSVPLGLPPRASSSRHKSLSRWPTRLKETLELVAESA